MHQPYCSSSLSSSVSAFKGWIQDNYKNYYWEGGGGGGGGNASITFLVQRWQLAVFNTHSEEYLLFSAKRPAKPASPFKTQKI